MVSRRKRPAPRRRRQRPPTKYTYYWRRTIVLLALVTVVTVGYYGVTFYQALTNPSYGASSMARIAEWGRNEGIGGFVTWAENLYNSLHTAKVGGQPGHNAFGGGGGVVNATGALPVPPRIVSPAVHPIAGEGVWHPLGRTTVNGVPAVYQAFIRPDAIHTSYVVGVAWMDTRLLRAQLYSGSQIPGPQGLPYTHTAPITAPASESLVAAFNAGFRMPDAQGGYYTDGKMLLPLRVGGASVVIYQNGTMSVGQWGRDFHSLAKVASVRQNLDLIVDNGRAVAGLDLQNNAKWGRVTGNTFNVWRSGLGVTSNGALVYVGGPALSIADLANVLVRAGAVRGMELDMNTDWVVYATYAGPAGSAINGAAGTNMLNSANAGANAMLERPSVFFKNWWTRDFFTMSLRPKELHPATAAKPRR
jgi:hypothetical protein